MSEKWGVTVTVGRPESSLAERIERSLPADTLPAYIDYSGDMRLSVVMVTVEADDEKQAAQQAREMVEQASSLRVGTGIRRLGRWIKVSGGSALRPAKTAASRRCSRPSGSL